MKIKNTFCPICHRQTYFTGEAITDNKRTEVIEWKCADCGAILKSKHDKLGREYNQRKKEGTLNPKPSIWIRKVSYRDLLFFEIGKKLYAFRYLDIERLQKDEILAIPVYQVMEER